MFRRGESTFKLFERGMCCLYKYKVMFCIGLLLFCNLTRSFERFPNKTPLNRANNLDPALILRQWFVDSERLKILLRLAIGSFDIRVG